MSKPVHVEEDAEEELRAAVAWYERQRPGLGAELLAEVQSVIDFDRKCSRCRRAGTPRPNSTRDAPSPTAPISVCAVYRERTDESQVIAFAHTSRMPGYWRSR